MATATTATSAAAAPTSSLPRLGRMRFSLAARPFQVSGLPNLSPLVDKHGISIRCSYAVANVAENKIDVVADVKTERIVILGGNGFVGSAVCKAAVSKGIEVVSLSRSGRPSYSDSWVDQVTWVSGVPKFILISVHEYNLPPFLLTSGYFTGKRQAESEVLSKYPNSGGVLRPSFIYGKRKVDGLEIPLDLIRGPLENKMISIKYGRVKVLDENVRF